MIDLSDIVVDPDLAEEFTIVRTTGSFQRGGWVAGAPTQLAAYGVVSVVNERELSMVPEGDRVKGSLAFYATREVYLTGAAGGRISDKILFKGEYYRIVNVAPWGSFGYWKAIGVRMAGD
jgi:hypothetical protein